MNKAVIGIMLVALLGGGFVGAAMMGVIDVPGLSPEKKAGDAQGLYDSDKTGDASAKQGDDKATSGSKSQPQPDSAGAKTGHGAATQSTAEHMHKQAQTQPKDRTGQLDQNSPKLKDSATTPPSKRGESTPTTDPELGCKKAAKLWNEMSVDALVQMVGAYKGPDLPRILALMDESKVGKVLQSLATDQKKAAQAAKLTKDIQKEASKVKAAP